MVLPAFYRKIYRPRPPCGWNFARFKSHSFAPKIRLRTGDRFLLLRENGRVINSLFNEVLPHAATQP